MTTDIDNLARELADRIIPQVLDFGIRSQGRVVCTETGIISSSDHYCIVCSLPIIKAALTTVRNEALDDAADLANSMGYSSKAEDTYPWEIRDSIRALKLPSERN